jgi:hypothetical protein
MPKISELNVASAADINNDDLLIVVDKKTQQTKQITVLEFARVMASVLGINIQTDAGGDVLERRPLAVNRTCGTTVSVDRMASKVMIDQYLFDGRSETLSMTYDMKVEKKRITIVGKYDKDDTSSILLYDTDKYVSDTGSFSFCKPTGMSAVEVYIRCETLSHFEYTLICTRSECDIYQDPAATPTTSSTPLATPTVTPTEVDFSVVDPTPTPSVTSSPTPSVTPSVTPTISLTPSVTSTYTAAPTATPIS